MPKYSLNIFLPAAGLGERLRPVTNHLPKPLLPVLGKPIIEDILERLTLVCNGRVGINLHWKSEQIRAWAGKSRWADRMAFFPETPILGTGGALKNAAPLLASGPFIVHNADILLHIDFAPVIETHIRNNNIATLVTHRLPHLSNVVIDDNDLLLDVENPGQSRPDASTRGRKVAYTGIAVYSPAILDFLPDGVSHATVAWIAAARAGHRVQAFDVTGAYWSDIGTPATYCSAVLDALRLAGESVHCSSFSRCGKIGMDGYVVVESDCAVESGTRLRNCIVMPDACASGMHENKIIGPDYALRFSEAEFQPTIAAREQKKVSLADSLFSGYFGITENPAAAGSDIFDAILIGMGGSDRRYYRVRNDGKRAVLMECSANDPDYARHILYTRFFSSHGVPVPGLISAQEHVKRALFEDLGDTSLYSYLKLPHDEEHIEDLYRSVIDIAVMLHTLVTSHVNELPILATRMFDYEHLRWETNYFLERFVLGMQNVSVKNREALDEELHRLAQKTDCFPKRVIHRDFQSQNIMLTPGGMPHVIDFQGARMAPAAYDIASMLWDPYYRLKDELRARLLGYYIEEMSGSSADFDEALFRKSLLPCRLQRHMQALGAYGFLSVVKGKKYFEKHVPEALRMLKEETHAAGSEYPELEKLIKSLG
jgi:NDP-sugar pyrophosphorylase family protein/aminoglycoside/choline kinase family phosphotransferase